MEIAFILAGIALSAIWLWQRMRRAKDTILHHPHVQPLDEALPVHGELIRELVNDLANIATVPAPEVFVYRANLPNAFVTQLHRRPKLFLADETFELANRDRGHTIDRLAAVIAHELAHLKLRQTRKHACLWWLARVGIPFARNGLARIEADADREAERILRQFHQPKRLTFT